MTCKPPEIRGGRIEISDAPGLGVELDMEKVAEARQLYQSHGPHERDDAAAMQLLARGWKFDPKRPCLAQPASGRSDVEQLYR